MKNINQLFYKIIFILILCLPFLFFIGYKEIIFIYFVILLGTVIGKIVWIWFKPF
jgi:hypothetical protein